MWTARVLPENVWLKPNAPDDFARIANDSRSCGGIFDLDAKRLRLTELEARMSEPGFWSDQNKAQEVVQQVKGYKSWIEPYDALVGRVDSAADIEELLASDPDDSMEREVAAEVDAIDGKLEEFRLKSLLSGPDDFRDAQVEIAAGAGGTEAQDWAE